MIYSPVLKEFLEKGQPLEWDENRCGEWTSICPYSSLKFEIGVYSTNNQYWLSIDYVMHGLNDIMTRDHPATLGTMKELAEEYRREHLQEVWRTSREILYGIEKEKGTQWAMATYGPHVSAFSEEVIDSN